MIFIVKDALKVLSRINNQSRPRWIHSVMSMVESQIDIDDNHGLDDDDDDDDDEAKDAKDVTPPAFTVATKYVSTLTKLTIQRFTSMSVALGV